MSEGEVALKPPIDMRVSNQEKVIKICLNRNPYDAEISLYKL